MATAPALSFPPDLLYASGTADSVWECTIPEAASDSDTCPDVAFLIAAVRITHFLATGVEDAVIGACFCNFSLLCFLINILGIATDDAFVQDIALRVGPSMPTAQVVQAATRALADARPVAGMGKRDTVVCARDAGQRQTCRFGRLI